MLNAAPCTEYLVPKNDNLLLMQVCITARKVMTNSHTSNSYLTMPFNVNGTFTLVQRKYFFAHSNMATNAQNSLMWYSHTFFQEKRFFFCEWVHHILLKIYLDFCNLLLAKFILLFELRSDIWFITECICLTKNYIK